RGPLPQGHGALRNHDHQAPGCVRVRKEPRLHFTKEEREDPALEKTIRRTDRAAARADKAQAAIPKKKVRERAVDPDTGAVTVHLRFEDKNKPPSKLTHILRDAPSGTV